MTISDKQLAHIANLAHLDLGEEEKTKFKKQLSDILDFVGILQRAETKKTEPLRQAVKLPTVWREDIVQDFLEQDALLGSAPSHKDGYVKTRPIFSVKD